MPVSVNQSGASVKDSRTKYKMPPPVQHMKPSAPDKRSMGPDTINMHSTESDTPDFQKQPHQRKQAKRVSRKVVTGKNTLNGDVTHGFKGAPEPDRSLFIYRVAPHVDTKDITEYLGNKAITVKNLECISHACAKFKSFKLEVPISEYPLLFNEDLWPHNVSIRKYNAPRREQSKTI